MINKGYASVVTFCLFAFSSSWASAQTPASQKFSSPAKVLNEEKPSPKLRKLDIIAEGQRTYVISMVTSLAEEANGFRDQTLRVRVQAGAADALWETDSELASYWFRRAWAAAEKIDRESERAADEARRRFLTSRQSLAFIPPVSNLRSDVLNLVARRDQHLGEDFLAQLEEAKEQETAAESDITSDSQLKFFDPTDPSTAIAKRLDLATELLRAGEVERAKAVADSGLKYVTSQGIIFLAMLRQRDAKAADERYSGLLAWSTNDQSSDATTVSLLSSYIFTPNLLVTATRRGRVSNQWSEGAITQEVPAGLRASFLRVAAEILLRQLPPQDQDRTSAGKAGTYFTIARLLPLFEQYAPTQLPALNARLSLLAPDTPEAYRSNENGMLTAGLVRENISKDDLSGILRHLSSATSAGERDFIYVKAVRAAALKGDGRAREFADRIENTDLRKRARLFADFVAVRKALDAKDVDGSLRIIRGGELQPLQRVWAYTEVAKLLKQSDASRAIQLLNDAASEVRNINNGELERIYALSCIASQFYTFDRARTWEVADDVVKSSNAIADSTADNGKLTVQLQVRDVVAMVNLEVPSFNLTNLFELLATDDFQRATSLANTFKGEAPRATANLAVARSLLRRQRVK